MKKTILAIAIPALFASAANAATVYDKDGTKFDVTGRVHAAYQGKANTDELAVNANDDLYYKRLDTTEKGEVYTYARFGMQGKVALNNTWSAVAMGEWEVQGEESDGDDQFKSRHILTGFDGSQYGKFLFGQTDTASKWGVQDRADIFEELGNVGNLNDGRQEGQVIYRGEWDGIFANASYITKNSSYKSGERFGIESGANTALDQNDKGLKSGYSLGAGYNMPNGFGFGVSTESKEFERGTRVKDFDGVNTATASTFMNNLESKDDWAIGASYAYDAFYVGALYNQSKLKGYDNGEEVKAKGYEIAGSYTIDAWKLLAGYNFLESKASDNFGSSNDVEMFNRVILGVEYAFTSNIKSYANYAIESADNKDDQWEFGMQYNF
ncbi:porin [Aeromonas veronii]|uniref:porin n=1 Tax=Aeromonas TaxID=642 RepID=UPI00191EB981|nr:porin [Aeromonas veronii]MBL0445831.1 porin [Aeromonas veronii]WMJ03585.1 porin [Aeromonas veronii]